MSLDAKNVIVESPYIFSEMAKSALAPLLSVLDASPIYTSCSCSVTMSGGFSDGDIDYNFEGDGESGTLSRISVRELEVFPSENNLIFTDRTGIAAQFDLMNITGEIDELDVVMTIGGFATKGLNIPPFCPPYIEWIQRNNFWIDGERTDNAEDPPVVLPIGAYLVVAIYFSGTIEDGDLKLTTELSGEIGTDTPYYISLKDEIDASAWGSADFRDIRGTYGGSDTDENGISYTWSITLG